MTAVLAHVRRSCQLSADPAIYSWSARPFFLDIILWVDMSVCRIIRNQMRRTPIIHWYWVPSKIVSWNYSTRCIAPAFFVFFVVILIAEESQETSMNNAQLRLHREYVMRGHLCWYGRCCWKRRLGSLREWFCAVWNKNTPLMDISTRSGSTIRRERYLIDQKRSSSGSWLVGILFDSPFART